eukprot:scaffold100_cov323-Pavlova_lutheri.AAC.1
MAVSVATLRSSCLVLDPSHASAIVRKLGPARPGRPTRTACASLPLPKAPSTRRGGETRPKEVRDWARPGDGANTAGNEPTNIRVQSGSQKGPNVSQLAVFRYNHDGSLESPQFGEDTPTPVVSSLGRDRRDWVT